MARAALTPSRQLVVGAATVAAALATVAAGVWMAAAGNPTLDRPAGRASLGAAPAVLLDASSSGARALPVPDSVGELLALPTSDAATTAPAVSAPPGGGPAAQPPALPPPPSPPPGAEPDPVEELVETVEDVIDGASGGAEEAVGDLDPDTTTLPSAAQPAEPTQLP